MLFATRPDIQAISQLTLEAQWAVPSPEEGCRPRIGRGGRLILDRYFPRRIVLEIT